MTKIIIINVLHTNIYYYLLRWKDINCPFRVDKETHLMVIPTLVKWKKPQRLEGEQCANVDLLKMFFEEDD